jgi:hypothetical protein
LERSSEGLLRSPPTWRDLTRWASNKWFGNRFGTFRTPNGVVTGIWALPRAWTRHWGSGDVLPNIRRIWGKVDISFGKRDQVDGLTVDNDPIVKPSIVADWRHLPFRDGQFGIGYWDPPYLGHIGSDGDVHYNRLDPCLHEICRVVNTLFILSPLIYPCPKGFRRAAVIAITMGSDKIIRSLQGFTRQDSLPETDTPRDAQ